MKRWIQITATLSLAVIGILLTDNTDLKTPRNTYLNSTDPELLTPVNAPLPAISEIHATPPKVALAPAGNSPRLPASTPLPTEPSAELEVRQARLEIARLATPTSSPEISDLYVHLPPDAPLKQPLRVVVALHGVGSRGDVFAQSLIADADRNGWLLIAPTFPYRDHMNPRVLLEDDLQYSRLLYNTLVALPRRLGFRLRPHALLYGFSRGGQLAHRFALFYPDRVESVVTMSAGTYTLPFERRSIENGEQLLPLPYGIADYSEKVGHSFDAKEFGKLSFWIAVGASDDRTSDVPRQFDPYVGKMRVQRATAFQNALKEIGVDTRLVVFPGVGHEISSEMRKDAVKFLRDDELLDKLND
ncbi:MAG: hypothetical protein HY327_01515 [Chloroflexi bacterium]|nr:hypothetical protein [Chloroflexota bacterium]